jgi:hypothetical protein
MKELSKVNRFYGKYTEQLDIEITRPIVRHRGPWAIVDKARFDVVVYDAQTGEYIETVSRSCEPLSPFGQWSVWRFSYAGVKHSSMVDEIWGYLVCHTERKVK